MQSLSRLGWHEAIACPAFYAVGERPQLGVCSLTASGVRFADRERLALVVCSPTAFGNEHCLSCRSLDQSMAAATRPKPVIRWPENHPCKLPFA